MKKHAKFIATHDILTLYTKLNHNKLKSKRCFIADFAFQGRCKTFIRLSRGAWL